MKRDSKSASNCNALAFLCMVLLLSACADARGPQWLTGEPGDDVLNAPRVVSGPSGEATTVWPNLADVPESKPKFTSRAARDRSAAELESDNRQAQVELERIRNIDLYGEAERTWTTTEE